MSRESSELIYPQIRSSWNAEPGPCNTPDFQVNIATVISMFITDFFLLAIMLVGLLRMHHRSASGVFLGSLLWKQVRRRGSQMAMVFSLR
jgi:hypothetical protein